MVEAALQRARPRHTRPSHALSRPGARLARELLALIGEDSVLLRAGEEPWASATYTGMRLILFVKIMPGCCHLRHFSRLRRVLAEAEFAIPGWLVADVIAGKVSGKAGLLHIEALMIEEA